VTRNGSRSAFTVRSALGEVATGTLLTSLYA
jgi:hypothetical protein